MADSTLAFLNTLGPPRDIKLVEISADLYALAVSMTAAQAETMGVQLEDAAHASGDPGVQILSVRKDSAAALGSADGKYQPLITDSSGRLYVRFPGVDVTNGLVKTAEINTAGTLISGADGTTITGVGVLTKLVITNGSASATTANVYDNTTNSGTKLTPLLALPANTTLVIPLDVPFSIGVYVDFTTATTCEVIGYYKVVV